MLKEGLKVDKVHQFLNISQGQIEEKITWLSEKTYFSHFYKTKSKQPLTLVVIINIGENGLFIETIKMSKQRHASIKNKLRCGSQNYIEAIDQTKLYKNFTEINWFDRNQQRQKELISMVDLSARISNNSCNNLILFDVAFLASYAYHFKKKENPQKKIPMVQLKERPGLQRITYTAVYDYSNIQGLLQQICERALQQRDVNVNKSLEFVIDKSPLTPLYSGQRPISVMIDNRSEKQFAKIKANKD